MGYIFDKKEANFPYPEKFHTSFCRSLSNFLRLTIDNGEGMSPKYQKVTNFCFFSNPNIFCNHIFLQDISNPSKHVPPLKFLRGKTVPRSAAAVLRLAALRPQLRLRLRPEVKPQGFWKNAQNEEKLENILKYLSIYTN